MYLFWFKRRPLDLSIGDKPDVDGKTRIIRSMRNWIAVGPEYPPTEIDIPQSSYCDYLFCCLECVLHPPRGRSAVSADTAVVFIYLFICSFVRLFVYFCLFVCLFYIYLFFNSFFWLFWSIFLFVCLFIYLVFNSFFLFFYSFIYSSFFISFFFIHLFCAFIFYSFLSTTRYYFVCFVRLFLNQSCKHVSCESD